MKFPKLIILIAAVIVVALFFLFERLTDHTAEFRRAIYARDISRVEELLRSYPALANARHMDSPNKKADWTPLHVAANLGDPEMITLLVRHGANLDARDSRGLTPLLWTAFAGQRAAAAELLSDGADINARGLDGRTTLDLAKLSLDNGMIELLRERGAKE